MRAHSVLLSRVRRITPLCMTVELLGRRNRPNRLDGRGKATLAAFVVPFERGESRPGTCSARLANLVWRAWCRSAPSAPIVPVAASIGSRSRIRSIPPTGGTGSVLACASPVEQIRIVLPERGQSISVDESESLNRRSRPASSVCDFET
jgi:hypothetical protein